MGVVLAYTRMGLFDFFRKSKSTLKVEPDPRPKSKFRFLKAKDKEGNLLYIAANSGYQDYQLKEKYPWHLWILMEARNQNDHGHPTDKEIKVLNKLERKIDATLNGVCTAHLVARITVNSGNELLYYVDDAEKAHAVLQTLTADPKPLREFEYRLEKDETWQEVNLILNKQ